MSFPTTAWSLLSEARDCPPQAVDRYLDILNRLICLYWRPVFGFLRARGYSNELAEDLTQEFWLRCFEERPLLNADRSRGKFRSFLLTILTRFCADQSPGRCRKQLAFEHGLVPVAALVRDDDSSFDVPEGSRADDVFMRQWAHSLVAAVREELRGWCHAKGRPDWHSIFERFHFPPDDAPIPSQEQLAHDHRCSRDQVRYAVDQTNRQFAIFLRAALADQVGSEDEIDAELAELMELLGTK